MSYIQDESFEYFVCYYEATAKDFAEAIHHVLTKDLGSRVYVNHVYRNKMSGKFRHNIDEIIAKCKIFILLNTIGALARPEVIREVKVAFPDGALDNHEFWILKQKSDEVPYVTAEFKDKTKIDLAEHTQPSFSNDSDLARIIMAKCYRKKRDYSSSLPRTNAPTIQPFYITFLKNQKSKLTTELNIDQLRDDARREHNNKNYMKALQMYDQILDNNPSDISAINEKAVVLAALGRFSEAQLQFSNAIYLNGMVPELWYNRALSLCFQGHNEKALNDMNKSISLLSQLNGPQTRDFFQTKATILYALSRYEESKEWFDKVLSIDPKCSSSISGKGAALVRLRHREEAFGLFHLAIELDSQNYNAWYNLGVLYEEDSKYQEALLHINRSLEINSRYYPSLAHKGRILRILSRNEEALKFYDSAINEKPESPEPYFNKGTCLGMMGRFEESLFWFDKSLEINPNSVSTILNKAESLYHLEKYEEALDNANKVLNDVGKNVNALKIIAFTFAHQSRYLEAEEKFKEVYKLDPNDLGVIYSLSDILWRQQKYSEELAMCNKALQIYPNDLRILVSKVDALIRLQQYVEAIQGCDKIIKLDNTIAIAYYNKGCAKALLHEDYEAIQLIKKAISLDTAYVHMAREDTDLVNLRNNEEFKLLIN